MIKYFLMLLIPIFINASLIYDKNHNEEVAVLESFDIDSSFLYDPVLNNMIRVIGSKYRNKHFFRTMDEAYLFVPAIKNILAEYDIPAEFLFLAMAESNFSTKAYSKKRAAGFWQFMPRTAKLYGLKIDEYVDERRDLIKSTRAAARHLSSLHRRFKKWYLAAIAYNCGGGRLSRAIKKAHSDKLDILLDNHKAYIPKESRFYIRKIIALSMLGSDEQFLLHSEYGHLLNRANAYSISTVRLSGGESLKRVSRLIGLPMRELKKLNRHLKYDFIPPYADGYDVYIPYIKLNDFKQKYYAKATKNIYKIYTVKRGDNLSLIGKKYGVSYKVIMDFNKLKNSRLRLKQKLIIPITKNSKKVDSRFYYMVKKGDTLDSISKAHKISVTNLKLQNHLKGSLIKIGDRLRIYE